jgi:hypothetical protein
MEMGVLIAEMLGTSQTRRESAALLVYKLHGALVATAL